MLATHLLLQLHILGHVQQQVEGHAQQLLLFLGKDLQLLVQPIDLLLLHFWIVPVQRFVALRLEFGGDGGRIASRRPTRAQRLVVAAIQNLALD